MVARDQLFCDKIFYEISHFGRQNSLKIHLRCTVDDLGQIFDLLSAWKLKSKNAPRDLKFNHNVAI